MSEEFQEVGQRLYEAVHYGPPHYSSLFQEALERINRLTAQVDALGSARDATIERAYRYETVLRKIAGNIQSGPLWDRHNLEDEMGGVSEPDFEGAYDHFIAICREALEGK